MQQDIHQAPHFPLSGIPKLIIMGHGRHGKGTFCDLAKKFFALESLSSSRFACDTFLFDKLAAQYGYQSADECFADRHRSDEMRQLWYQAIADYNTPDKTRLGRGIYGKAPIYDGIRDDLEFYALKEAKAFDLAIWIDASERLPLEPSSSIKVSANDADIIITNHGTPESYERKVIALLRMITSREPMQVGDHNRPVLDHVNTRPPGFGTFN